MNLGALSTAAVLMCAAAACAWKLEPRLGHEHAQIARRWHVCAGLLFCLSLVYALQLDAGVLKWGRGAAMEAGLYRWRRLFQAVLLITVVMCCAGIVRRLLWRSPSAGIGRLLKASTSATGVIVVVLAMRTISLHGVDTLVEFRLLGIGLGRWLEWSASLVIIASAVQNGRVRRARTQNQLKAWESHRV